jgi:hypothetical protein
VVGEAELPTVVRELASLGRPGCWSLDNLEAASEQVIDRLGVSETAEAEALAQGLEGIGVLGGPQVEVPPEEQRRIPGPLDRRFGRAEDIHRGEVRPVVGRVQVGNTELPRVVADRGAGKRHRPSLRPPGVDRQLSPLYDPAVPVRFFAVMGG